MRLPQKSLVNYVYILKEDEDKPPEEQTRWILRPLTFAEDTALVNRISKGMADGDTAKFAIEAALVNIENLLDDEGTEVEIRTQKRSPLGRKVETVHTDILDLIPSRARHEVARTICDHGHTTEDDQKN